jgi:hypothetical protein
MNEVKCCSFCFMLNTKDDMVAGTEVYICPRCVGLCVGVFARKSPSWRDDQLAVLTRVRDETGGDSSN